jgi:ParB-like chromosome segregation protein Spo0J
VARKSADSGIKVEMVALAKIEAYPNNAKVHPEVQIGQIMASIRQFGFINPILIDRAGEVVAGHGRLLAASRLGMAQVPVIRLGHLTPEQAKALRIADNSIAESGTRWDVDLLEAELASLRAVKFDLEPLGLDSIELPELEELQQVAPKPNRSKTTIFVSITNAQVEKARKAIVAALDKAKIGHNL